MLIDTSNELAKSTFMILVTCKEGWTINPESGTLFATLKW